ncbi:DUF2490 domain-containing protein [Legionella jordanis]|uniref:DUF2490 domain-containing protein n=1 Tax=Legionella jordanis TaxID=456 RepID=A0A0W0VBB7_9GAMM|nr:DUF2490 domain-containing protein [Legionella jordanis]KTD17197.1 hypothetical protein Ljor_1503 [Legionella jordanis]RMX03317.1 DUF2490 domain-containing protein [Legionella jordanis]RMX18295.1 DUF2490 domain-containing protein [Legionella jordanis]VEH12605.1 Protein of uncharacterised function (DUF2490) [Legionella jordanis]HAT8713321.1 DUF2490 domain-containing protein [Legionella jordanis]
MRSVYFLICIAFFLPKSLYAAQTTEKIWTVLGLNTTMGKFSYQLEPQLRQAVRNNLFGEFLTNFSGSYQWSSSWQFSLGTTSINAKPLGGPMLHEMRLWEQGTYSHPGSLWLLRSRLEQRTRQDSNEISYRLRERLLIKKPLIDKLSLVVFDEIFVNLNKPDWEITPTIAQNRVLISLDQQASDRLTVGAGYIFQTVFSHPLHIGHVASLYWQLYFPEQ